MIAKAISDFFKGFIMKLLISIVVFYAFAFAQNPQTQSLQPAQTSQNAPQYIVAPMSYPNQAITQSIITKV